MNIDKAVGDLNLVVAVAHRSPAMRKAARDLYDQRQPLFTIITGEDGQKHLEPTDRLRRLAKQARRLSLNVVETTEGTAP